jgi:hypothetical protein
VAKRVAEVGAAGGSAVEGFMDAVVLIVVVCVVRSTRLDSTETTKTEPARAFAMVAAAGAAGAAGAASAATACNAQGSTIEAMREAAWRTQGATAPRLRMPLPPPRPPQESAR